MRTILTSVTLLLLIGSLMAQSERGIDIVQRSSGVFIYRYAETMEQIDPRKDFLSRRQISDPAVIADLKRIMADSAGYTPDFKARCLPVWDLGIEFRGGTESRMYLFSFRCNTMKAVEENLFKDFTPQRTDLYALLQYEINERTTIDWR
jgi:hypothetical protein